MSILCTGWILNACQSKRGIIEDRPDQNLHQGYINLLEGRNHHFKTLKLKRIQIELDINGVRENAKGNIAIERDSLIVISVIPALGYEAMRIMCRPDSVIMIDRLERRYTAGPFEHFQDRYGIPLTFNELQAMLSNEVFHYRHDEPHQKTTQGFRPYGKQEIYILETYNDDTKVMNQRMYIERSALRLHQVQIHDFREKLKLNLIYDAFEGTARPAFPRELKMEIIEPHYIINMHLEHGQVIFDETVHVDFEIPASYQQTKVQR